MVTWRHDKNVLGVEARVERSKMAEDELVAKFFL